MMTEQSALEIADRLKEIYYGKTGIEAAAMLRQQHDEIVRLGSEYRMLCNLLKRIHHDTDREREDAVAAERLRIAELVESYKATPGLAGWDAWPQQIGLVIRAGKPEIE